MSFCFELKVNFTFNFDCMYMNSFSFVHYLATHMHSVQYVRMYSITCLVHTYLKGDTISTYRRYLLTVGVGSCTYMRYTQGQNEEYLLSRSMY